MIEIANGVVDPKLILGLDANAELDLHNRPSHHDGFDDHEHDDFDTVVIQIEEISDIDQLKDRIANLAEKESILRIKGFVAVKDKPMRLLVQAVGKRVRCGRRSDVLVLAILIFRTTPATGAAPLKVAARGHDLLHVGLATAQVLLAHVRVARLVAPVAPVAPVILALPRAPPYNTK